MLGLYTQSEFLASHTSARTWNRSVDEVEIISIFSKAVCQDEWFAFGRVLPLSVRQEPTEADGRHISFEMDGTYCVWLPDNLGFRCTSDFFSASSPVCRCALSNE